MLIVNDLTGFGAGRVRPSFQYLENHINAADGASQTHPITSFGTPRPDRWIAVIAHGRTASSISVSSMTIAGVSASLALALSSGVRRTEIWVANVPTATSGDVVVTWDSSANNSQVGVYALYGINSATPVATATTTTDNGALDLNVQAGDIVISGGSWVNTTAGTTTWTGLTENYDSNSETTAFNSGASVQVTANASPLAIASDINRADSTSIAFIAAAWR